MENRQNRRMQELAGIPLKEIEGTPLSRNAVNYLDGILMSIKRMGREDVDDQYISTAETIQNIQTYEDLEAAFQSPDFQFGVGTTDYEKFLEACEEEPF